MNTPHYINGRWQAGEGADVLTVYNPALGLPFVELIAASSEQVDQSVAAARTALPAWKNTPVAERAAVLRGFAEHLTQRR